MQNELIDTHIQSAGFFLDLATDKAYRCSPYIGSGCVITSATNHLIGAGAQRLGEHPHILNVLYEQIHESNTTAYLSHEPYLLNDLAQKELLELLCTAGMSRIHIANLAPGRFAGKWSQVIKSYGINVETGDRKCHASLQARVGEKLVSKGMPWITCTLFLNAREKDISCNTFRDEFGFETDFNSLIYAHSVLLTSPARNGFRSYIKRNLCKNALGSHLEPMIMDTKEDLATESGYKELINIKQTNKWAVMLMPVSLAVFRALEKRGIVDELIVYQTGPAPYKKDEEYLNLIRDSGKWHLQDYSPLGDGHRFIYRSFIVKHGLAIQ